MPKAKSIPVNYFANEFNRGISIEKISVKDIHTFREANQPHRHDCHSFMLLEKGSVTIEIDFRKYRITSPSIIYMHPNQVHLVTAFKNVTVSSLAITDENLNADYISLLDDINPARPILIKQEIFSTLTQVIKLCMNLADKKRNSMYRPLLKSACNVLVGLFISEYADRSKPADTLSRYETVTKAFTKILERNYLHWKKPSEYAKSLHFSIPYLNECVRKTTGYSVSHHIQQRVILEAKRLLYHSNQSIKEISSVLGYDDHHYFSRLFSKIANVSPQHFRNKKLDSSNSYLL